MTNSNKRILINSRSDSKINQTKSLLLIGSPIDDSSTPDVEIKVLNIKVNKSEYRVIVNRELKEVIYLEIFSRKNGNIILKNPANVILGLRFKKMLFDEAKPNEYRETIVMHPVNQAARLRVAHCFSKCSRSNAFGSL